MNVTRLRNQIDAITQLQAKLADRSRPALTAISRAADVNDGYKTTASGADTGPGGGSDTTSSVERAVERRLGASHGKPGPVTDLTDLEDWVRAIAQLQSLILGAFDRYTDTLTDKERSALRCIGDGTPQGANCDRWASRKGMCDACYMRARRRAA
jgi:hypothetical protein